MTGLIVCGVCVRGIVLYNYIRFLIQMYLLFAICIARIYYIFIYVYVNLFIYVYIKYFFIKRFQKKLGDRRSFCGNEEIFCE